MKSMGHDLRNDSDSPSNKPTLHQLNVEQNAIMTCIILTTLLAQYSIGIKL